VRKINHSFDAKYAFSYQSTREIEGTYEDVIGVLAKIDRLVWNKGIGGYS
jgi:hypothetical protein